MEFLSSHRCGSGSQNERNMQEKGGLPLEVNRQMNQKESK
jgi:hypothetical protein